LSNELARLESVKATAVNREYYKRMSDRLGRVMEMLVFGHGGLPVLAFPTSAGRFYDFENNGMVCALAGKIDAGHLQLFCVDSVDAESWYNLRLPPRLRMARQMQFERYILDEVVPVIRGKNDHASLLTMGCSLGGYHAVNIALRHPDTITGFLSLSGVFDLTEFLDGYYDQDCYFNLPTHYLPNLSDAWYLDRYKRNRNYLLATGWDDQCLKQNQELGAVLTAKAIPHKLSIWDAKDAHNWPTWQRMAKQYL
jgi:esterase/lipase superfamily enzyme